MVGVQHCAKADCCFRMHMLQLSSGYVAGVTSVAYIVCFYIYVVLRRAVIDGRTENEEINGCVLYSQYIPKLGYEVANVYS